MSVTENFKLEVGSNRQGGWWDEELPNERFSEDDAVFYIEGQGSFSCNPGL